MGDNAENLHILNPETDERARALETIRAAIEPYAAAERRNIEGMAEQGALIAQVLELHKAAETLKGERFSLAHATIAKSIEAHRAAFNGHADAYKNTRIAHLALDKFGLETINLEYKAIVEANGGNKEEDKEATIP